MTPEEKKRIVEAIIEQHTEGDTFSTGDSLNLSSLDTASVIGEMEDALHIEIRTGDVHEGLRTVQDFLDLVP